MTHHSTPDRRTWLIGMAATLAARPGWTQPSGYPERPVRFIVNGPAGSSPDIAARLVTQKLSEVWKHGVVIDNRSGAAGIIGAQTAAQAAPDGYTYFYTINSALCANPHLYSKLPYDALRSFDPVALSVRLGYVLVAGTASSIDSLQKMIDQAKANPGKLNYSSSGIGAGNHISMEMLSGMAGIRMTHIPMQDGAVGISGNTVDIAMVPYTTAVPLVRGGRAKALAVTLSKRLDSLPDVPAVGELLPGFEADVWHGFLAPAGTPPAMVNKVAGDIAAALALPDLRARLADLGITAVGLQTREFGQVIRNDYDKWGRVITRAGIKIE